MKLCARVPFERIRCDVGNWTIDWRLSLPMSQNFFPVCEWLFDRDQSLQTRKHKQEDNRWWNRHTNTDAPILRWLEGKCWRDNGMLSHRCILNKIKHYNDNKVGLDTHTKMHKKVPICDSKWFSGVDKKVRNLTNINGMNGQQTVEISCNDQVNDYFTMLSARYEVVFVN